MRLVQNKGRKDKMEQRRSGRKIRLFCVAVSALFIALTAWLYYREDLYIKTMTLEAVPDEGRFQAEILADGRNVEVLCDDPSVELFVDRKTVEGKLRLLIHGICQDTGMKEPIRLRVVSDSGNPAEKWKYQILTGSETKKPVLTGRENRGRVSYVLSAVFTTMMICLLSADMGRKRRSREAASCASEVLDMMRQDSTMENSWKEGRRLFVLFERRKEMNLLLTVWLWLFMAFWMVHRTYRGVPFKSQAGFYGVLIVILLILALLLSRTLELSFVKILTKECRPLTAAAAFLFMGTEGLGSRKNHFIWYQNGATGLYRAGYYEEALAIARAARPLAGKKLKDAKAYVYMRLKYLCLEELGRSQEAEREKQNIEKLLDTCPALRKRQDIQNNLDMDNIREWVEAGELEQAEAGAQALLNRCQEGYFRLPVLGILKSIKEYMGKEGEAEILRNEILTFSPENKEVHEAMREGHLTYLPKKLTGADKTGSAIRAMLAMGIITFIFLTAGCGHKPAPESTGVVEEETGVAVEPSSIEETETAGGRRKRIKMQTFCSFPINLSFTPQIFSCYTIPVVIEYSAEKGD